MGNEDYQIYYCYNEGFAKLVRLPFSQGQEFMIRHGFNIIEGLPSLPKEIMFSSSLVIGVKSNGISRVIKNRYRDVDENPYVELITKCSNRHKFTLEETALYLTDPDHFVRSIFQHHISQK